MLDCSPAALAPEIQSALDLVPARLRRGPSITLAPMLEPTRNHVIVKPEARAKTTEGGLHLPDTMESKVCMFGKVVAVGPGYTTEHGAQLKPKLRLGSRVLFMEKSALPIEHDGQGYVLLHEPFILAVDPG